MASKAGLNSLLRRPWVLPLVYIIGLLDCITLKQLKCILPMRKAYLKRLIHYGKRLNVVQRVGRGFCSTELCRKAFKEMVVYGFYGKYAALEFLGVPILVSVKPTRIAAYTIPKSILERLKDTDYEAISPTEASRLLGIHPKVASRALRFLKLAKKA